MFLTCSSFYYLQTVDEHYYFYYSFLNCQRKDMKLTTTEHWVFQWGSCSKPGQEQLCTWHVSGWPEMWNEAQSLLSVRELVQHAPVGLRGVENTPLSQLDAPSLRWVRCLVLLQDETGRDSHPFHAWKCWNVSEYTGKKKKKLAAAAWTLCSWNSAISKESLCESPAVTEPGPRWDGACPGQPYPLAGNIWWWGRASACYLAASCLATRLADNQRGASIAWNR